MYQSAFPSCIFRKLIEERVAERRLHRNRELEEETIKPLELETTPPLFVKQLGSRNYN